ncbi:MAG: response regulator [Usitatibacter sp.]
MATEDFRRIFESLRVAVAGADAQGVIAFANAAFVELAAHERALPGTDLGALFYPADRKRVQQNVARVGEGKAASAFLDAQLAGGDEMRWVSVVFQPWLDSKDKPSGVIAIVQDIGSQRDTEFALNLAAARLMALAEASPAAKMIETGQGDIELVNEAFCRLLLLEAAPQSLFGINVAETLARSPRIDARALKRLCGSPDTPSSVEIGLDDGRRMTLERHPIFIDAQPAGAVWITREEAGGGTPEKGVAQMALIEKIAQELSVALEGLGTLSIRAQRSDFEPVLVEHYQRIRTATETAMAAIGDLVDFSRLSGGVVLHKRPFALRPALAHLIARVATAAEERGSRLRMKVEQDVTDSLEGDVERLQMILKNLLDSALAVAPGAELLLQITPEYMTESGIQISFSVVASGPAAQSPARASPEAGMGVAVAKFMVAAMGGKLAIAARAGTEALYAFTIEFAVRPAPPAPPRAIFATLVAMPALVVSGSPEQRNALSALLRGWRMVPLEADNAPMALALLERLQQEGSPIPLVILANRLPVQDGFLLAFRIKHDPRFAATLIMMLASEGKPGDAIACRENGVSAYMRYPVSDHQLNEAIVAVTGARVDADETPTLVTRHSLREQRRGATVLLVDRSRDSQILAAHILGREDCSVVVAHDLAEAIAALDQDTYDVVLVETSLAGLSGPDAAASLRGRIGGAPESTRIVAVSLEHSPAYRKAKLAEGFDATVAKPFRKEDLLALLAAS